MKGEETKVCKLQKDFYGLKQAPRIWYSRIESYFSKEGFSNYPHEHTLFAKEGAGGKLLVVSMYVDDLIYTGSDEVMCRDFKRSMKREFEMTDLGKMKSFLGVEVSQTEAGVFTCQQKYANGVLERFGMRDSKMVTNPIVSRNKLCRDEKGRVVDVTSYKQMISSLMYLTSTRPNLMYAVCLPSRYMERSTETHLIAIRGF